MRTFKQTLENSANGGPSVDADKTNLLLQIEDMQKDATNLSSPGRTTSALIATASLLVNDLEFDIKSVNLDIPVVVQENLEQMLLPYLNAVKLDGYQTRQTRKVFVIGNTRKSVHFLILITMLP